MRVMGLAIVALLLGSCESGGGGGGLGTTGGDVPLTGCGGYSYTDPDTSKKSLGETCTSDDECAFGLCVLPSTPGNEINTVFGFCSRGCDCGNDPASRVTGAEDETFECIYTPTPNQHQRYVAIECNDVSSCQAFDSRWDLCKTPSGTSRRICHAGVE